MGTGPNFPEMVISLVEGYGLSDKGLGNIYESTLPLDLAITANAPGDVTSYR